jgi:TetR/AcrR family transcriptional repressor of lmrAB and yxaGH operons
MFDDLSANGAPGTRDRLIGAMLQALSTRGFHGVGINELLAQARAPKGVLYHHFPGGKTALAVATIGIVIAHINAGLAELFERHGNPEHALRAWMQGAEQALLGSDFGRGCPLATIALESTPQDTAIREALADGFSRIRQTLDSALRAAGVEAGRARTLAALIVSAYEGALLQARVAGSVDALRDTVEGLLAMVGQSLPRRRR